MMKRLIAVLLCVFGTLVVGCSASMSEENVGETQAALCTGAPVATGNVGSAATSPKFKLLSAWPGEAYSMRGVTSDITITKLSLGSTSGVTYRTSGCTGFDGACSTWPYPTTSLKLSSFTDTDPWVSVIANGTKVAEFVGVNANTSLQNTQSFSGGLTQITQDTGTNGRFYFNGYDGGVWKSVSATFYNACSSGGATCTRPIGACGDTVWPVDSYVSAIGVDPLVPWKLIVKSKLVASPYTVSTCYVDFGGVDSVNSQAHITGSGWSSGAGRKIDEVMFLNSTDSYAQSLGCANDPNLVCFLISETGISTYSPILYFDKAYAYPGNEHWTTSALTAIVGMGATLPQKVRFYGDFGASPLASRSFLFTGPKIDACMYP